MQLINISAFFIKQFS